MSGPNMNVEAPSVDASAPTKGAISREQFLRGIGAIQRYREMCQAIRIAYDIGGCADRVDGFSGDDILGELTRQLEERCNDPRKPHGSMIEYMLYDCGGPVHLSDGRHFMVDAPGLLWDYWRAVGEGPFDGEAAKREPSSTKDERPDNSAIESSLLSHLVNCLRHLRGEGK